MAMGIRWINIVVAVALSNAITNAFVANDLENHGLGFDNFDSRRVNSPKVPFALSPLQWGSVSPRGWIEAWAQQASVGAGSPTKAVFAQMKIDGESVNGWKNGRPTVGGFWDEDSAYWIDGMTRLSLVLKDATLLNRVKEDIDFVVQHPENFHNTWQGDVVEGWVRSIYSRALLAYYDGTGDQHALDLLITVFAFESDTMFAVREIVACYGSMYTSISCTVCVPSTSKISTARVVHTGI